MEHAFLRGDVATWLVALGGRPLEGVDGAVLTAMTQRAEAESFPIVGPEVGRLLVAVAKMVSARRIFEMGSGFGYSTLFFASALGEGGEVVHTDGDPENSTLAKRFLEQAGVAERVRFCTGDAVSLITEETAPFDIVFCDVDKEQYPAAYHALVPKVGVGGVVLVDNLIWGGRVAAGEDDEASAGVRQYIDLMWGDERFVSCLLPIRDGVGLSLRIR